MDKFHKPVGLTGISTDLLAAIGLVTVYWSSLENSINRLLGAMLDLSSNEMMLVIAPMNISTKLQLLRSLADHGTHDVAPEKLRDIANLTDDVIGERNDLIHGFWANLGADPKQPVMGTISYKGRGGKRLKGKQRQWDAESAQLVADKIFHVMITITLRFGPPKPSPDKSR